MIASEFRRDLLHQITRVPWLLSGIVCIILCFAVSVRLRLVTDGWMDRRTCYDSEYCASIAFRYKFCKSKNSRSHTYVVGGGAAAAAVLVIIAEAVYVDQ